MITQENIKDVSLTATPASVNFCALWPAAKTGLQALLSIVKNPFVKITIQGVITLGDGLCPGTNQGN